MLPISLLIHIVFSSKGIVDGSADWFNQAMAKQHPYVQKEKEALVELVRRVAAVKESKMAGYATTVEGLCKEFTVSEEGEGEAKGCEVVSCKEYLSDSYSVEDVNLEEKKGVAHENELMPSDDPGVVLQQLINHGNFKYIHCRCLDWFVVRLVVPPCNWCTLFHHHIIINHHQSSCHHKA